MRILIALHELHELCPLASASSAGSRELRVRQSPKTGWFVEGLREFLIRTPEEAMRFLASGDKRKHTAESEPTACCCLSHSFGLTP